uniref:GOLD domain-containing protein n=1 Tax=Arion vulgaris TaxID=1028688 RepID=A0A0B7B3Z3_9EUPU
MLLPRIFYIFCFSLTGVSAYFAREAFIVVVYPKDKFCFSKTFTNAIKVIFEYSVTAGGNHDIDARIVTPNGLIIYKEEKKNGDEVSFNAQNGDFKFCFSNEFSKVTTKRVAFNIRPYDEASVDDESANNQAQVKGPLEAFCDNIHFLMMTVMDFQMKYMVRESMGRYIAEDLNKRVMWWSLGQSVIIVLAGFGQVFIFKKFFTEKRSTIKTLTVAGVNTLTSQQPPEQ